MSDVELSRLGTDRMEVYWCLKCMSDGPVFFEYGGPHFVLIEDASEFDPINDPESARPPDRVSASLEFGKPTRRGQRAEGSRVGGFPAWIQEPEVPECFKCGEGMEFLLQLASDSKFAYGADMGTLYTFVCTKCRIGCNLVQSH